jgi:hyperosmotically inducible protein
MRKAIEIIFVLSLISTAMPTLAQTSTSNDMPASEVSTTKTTTTALSNSDTKIVGMIYKRYAKDSALNGTALTVTCTNGVVEISGDVTMTSQAQEAVIVAKSVEGVKKVNSSIKVKTNPIKTKPPAPNY